MLIERIKSLRWLTAELVVIVLGILIAFQVEEWRQGRELKSLEVNAFEEVLADLASIEFYLHEAIETMDSSTAGAVEVVKMMQAGTGSEDELLENLGKLDVYLVGEAKGTYAFEGLLEAGRFANVDDAELHNSMRDFFSAVKPWGFTRNVIHIKKFTELHSLVHEKIQRVPDENYAANMQFHKTLAVPVEEYLASPVLMDDLLAFVSSSEGVVEVFEILLQTIEDLRKDIHAYLGREMQSGA